MSPPDANLTVSSWPSEAYLLSSLLSSPGSCTNAQVSSYSEGRDQCGEGVPDHSEEEVTVPETPVDVDIQAENRSVHQCDTG